MTPQAILDGHPALTISQTATVINRVHVRGPRKGQPNELAVRELIRDGRLQLVDPTVPHKSWTVTRASIRRYLSLDLAATPATLSVECDGDTPRPVTHGEPGETPKGPS